MDESGGSYLFDMSARGDWVRLRTLAMLRWIAVLGQSAAVLAASLLLDYQLPLGLCAGLISAAVLVNAAALAQYPADTRLSERGTLLWLIFDLIQIVLLLSVTGGLNNPFALLILAPVTIAASALRLQSALWIGSMAILLVVVMSNIYLPLIGETGTALETPEIFRSGIMAALAIAIAFLTLYARRVSVESYAMSQALSATQLALSREQRLSEIGTLAAATAHELGTPLATIKLTAKELARDLREHDELAEDARLIHSEAERCGRILAGLAMGGSEDAQMRSAPVSTVLEEAAAPHLGRGKEVTIRIDGGPAAVAEDQPIVIRRPELVHGLRNLIQNAVDFAAGHVWIDISRPAGELRISVSDDGPGFAPEVLSRLGEPFVSTRARGARRGGYEGMGLGLFIARTLLERTGARLSFANGSAPRRRDPGAGSGGGAPAARGAVIEVTWKADAIVIEKPPGRRGQGRHQTTANLP